MRFAGDVDFEVRNNEDIEAALDTFKRYIIEALPTQDANPFSLKLLFDAEATIVTGSLISEQRYT